MTAVDKPALLVHALFATEEVTGPARAAFDALWDGAGELGITEPVTGLPHEARAPARLTEAFHVLRALRSDRPHGVEQAIAVQTHDTVLFTLMLAPNRPDTTWTGLEQAWRGTAADITAPGVIGSAALHLGLTPRTGEDAARRARPLLPAPADGPWHAAPTVFSDGQTVWELPGSLTHRRLLVLAPPEAEDALDHWLWTSPAPRLVPFTRYLTHAIRLRDAVATVTRDLDRLRNLTDRADRACDDLNSMLMARNPPSGDLVRASTVLHTLQADGTGLITSLSALRTMHRTVRVTQENMTELLSPVGDAPLLEADRQLGRWLDEQLESETTYLTATGERASQTAAAGRAAVDDHRNRQHAYLTLLQTSLLGALVTALTAVQSLQYEAAVSGLLKAPLIALLTALSLWLPTAVLHWPRVHREGRRLRPADYVFAAGVLACLGWLAASGVGASRGAAPTPPLWACLAAVSTAVAGTAALATWSRSRTIAVHGRHRDDS
ncbi:BN6_48550 family protein [Streptomyces sp. NBC_00638]|uniref:CATRA conflict system CASPASE/TPR repeat-associated protein n=1 Tax=Streptomyces sp. NBC_00638 TaxID=2975794 RepID=UPI0022502C77|nr:CATRA conflict system CASPASE/TPR repeat-associated protein [Streptomyces sp. NBC_00638]MCX5007818.1 BN6_48550 family protein [Streptomyces sp. NBC_00638]